MNIRRAQIYVTSDNPVHVSQKFIYSIYTDVHIRDTIAGHMNDTSLQEAGTTEQSKSASAVTAYV